MDIAACIAQIVDNELSFSFSLSGGPGGQNVNKVSTKATLKWDFQNSSSLSLAWKGRFQEKYAGQISKSGFLVLNCASSRSQLQNRQEAIDKLAEMLRLTAKAPKRRIATKASAASKRRHFDSKKHHSEKKSNRRKVD